jgi:transposase
MEYIALDAHKQYTWARVELPDGTVVQEKRIPHERGAIRRFLASCEPGSPVAVETIGSWYWIVDEVEEAGFLPQLVHAHKAKLMLGQVSKTDRLDARGLIRLQRTGTLPTVWIPSRELRDLRDLPRTRMLLVRQRTQLKNRIHATLAKYALVIPCTDVFGKRGRETLLQKLQELPPQTAFTTMCLLNQIDALNEQITRIESRMGDLFEVTEEVSLLMTIPGVGFILAVVILTEAGDPERFGRTEQFASYSGMVPRVHESGGRRRYGPLRSDVNHYLKWAFVEAANAVCRQRTRYPNRHVSLLYDRVRKRRGHQKAICAVARHLAEATYWVLTKREPYREPGSSTGA